MNKKINKIFTTKIILILIFPFFFQNISARRGLQNNGSTCFLNSTLQCLASFKDLLFDKLIEKNQEQTCLCKILNDLADTSQGRHLDIKNECDGSVLNNLFSLNKNGGFGGTQHPVAKLLSKILSKDSCFVDLDCLSYSFNLTRPDVRDQLNLLIFDTIKEDSSFQDLLNEQFTKKFKKTPNIFIMCIERGLIDVKILTNIIINENITIDEEQTDVATPVNYELFGIIYHNGRTPSSGHYTALVEERSDGLDSWWYCNDICTEKIEEKKLGDYLKNKGSFTPVVVFYRKLPEFKEEIAGDVNLFDETYAPNFKEDEKFQKVELKSKKINGNLSLENTNLNNNNIIKLEDIEITGNIKIDGFNIAPCSCVILNNVVVGNKKIINSIFKNTRSLNKALSE